MVNSGEGARRRGMNHVHHGDVWTHLGTITAPLKPPSFHFLGQPLSNDSDGGQCRDMTVYVGLKK